MSDEIRNPWALLTGLAAGGVAWAVGLPFIVVALLAVSVWSVYVVVAAATAKGQRPAVQKRRQAAADSEEAVLLKRGRNAASRFDGVAREIPDGPIAVRSQLMSTRVTETVHSLERLALNVTSASAALDEFDPGELASERQRLRKARKERPDHAEHYDRSLRSIEAQQSIHERLVKARGDALARLESGVFGLEGLHAGVVELAVLAASGPAEGSEVLAEMATELDGIRAGLAEAEQVTRRALGAYTGEGKA